MTGQILRRQTVLRRADDVRALPSDPDDEVRCDAERVLHGLRDAEGRTEASEVVLDLPLCLVMGHATPLAVLRKSHEAAVFAFRKHVPVPLSARYTHHMRKLVNFLLHLHGSEVTHA
jgi:hypothetical protein